MFPWEGGGDDVVFFFSWGRGRVMVQIQTEAWRLVSLACLEHLPWGCCYRAHQADMSMCGTPKNMFEAQLCRIWSRLLGEALKQANQPCGRVQS